MKAAEIFIPAARGNQVVHGAIVGDNKQYDPDNLNRPWVAAMSLFFICTAKDS
jgi:hypothetical protein